MNDLTTKRAISRAAFPKQRALVLSSPEAALAVHGRASLFPRVPAWLHHFLHSLSLCWDFRAETWLLLHFLLLSMFAFLDLDVSSVF